MSESKAFTLAVAKIEGLPAEHVIRVVYGMQTEAVRHMVKRDLTDAERGLVACQTLAGMAMTHAADARDIAEAEYAFTMLTEASALFLIAVAEDAALRADAPRSADDAVLDALWARTVARDN